MNSFNSIIHLSTVPKEYLCQYKSITLSQNTVTEENVINW